QWRYQNALVDAQWVSSQLVDQQTVGRGQADALPSTSTIAAATRAAALNDWWSDTSELALDLVTTHNSQSAAFTQQIALQYRTFAEAASAADQTYIASVATGDATYLSELANADAM